MRTKSFRRHILGAVAVLLAAGQAAPALAVDYLTEGVDKQRTGWMRGETTLTKANVGSMKLLWKTTLPSTPRQMHNVHNPLIAEAVQTSQGVKQIAIAAGISDQLWGIDASNGTVLWTKNFDQVGMTAAQLTAGGGILCPGGQTAQPAMEKTGPNTYKIYAMSWDGRLWQVDAATGNNLAEPIKFGPPNAKPHSLNVVDDVVYTVNSQGCGGIPFSALSLNLKTQRASALLPQGGGMWGRRGVAVDSEGYVYQNTGDSPYNPDAAAFGNAWVQMKKDDNDELRLTDFFAPWNANWAYRRDQDLNLSPMILEFGGNRWFMGSSKECTLWLVDAKDNFAGNDNRTTIDTSDWFCNDRQDYDNGVWGAMATYVDSAGTPWVYIPFWGAPGSKVKFPVVHGNGKEGGIAAFKIQRVSGNWKLVPAWIDTNINRGDSAIVANGVVYTFGSGEDTRQQGREFAWDEERLGANRIANSTHATIFAFDAATGRKLWDSGDQITSWNHWGNITVANGKVYLATWDGTLWCFGLQR